MCEYVMSLNIWDRVLEPVPMLFVGLVIGALIAGLLVYNLFWASFYKKKRELKFLNASNGVSNSVMNIVQMGVVAFTENGKLLFNNKTTLEKLHVDKLPQVFSEFVTQFIPDKEVMMKLRMYESLLSETRSSEDDDEELEDEKNESVTTRVEIHNRIIQFHFSKPFFPQSTLRGWVVVLEDVTTVARQEQQRRLFVSTVSHELKTPLATINGYSETLIDWGLREKSPDQIFSDVLKINEESQRITAIISNLTFLSQIENNKEKIIMTVYKIDKAVENICRRYQEEARKKGIRLYYQSMTRNMPTVFGSQSMMEQMVSNLINNALKYSPRNTGIWVFIQAQDNSVTIKVQDQGKGIPQADAERVFQAFFRVDETGSRAAGGSGLGLAIVKMMAEVQEGQVDLVTRCADDDDSKRSEIGSDFYITVPTAECVFRETLQGIRDGAEREEVLYRKAKQYMDKINNDDYDLGFDLKEVRDPQDEKLLISHLVFIDDCDIIDEAGYERQGTPVMQSEEQPVEVYAQPEPEAAPVAVQEEPVPVPVQEYVEPVPILEEPMAVEEPQPVVVPVEPVAKVVPISPIRPVTPIKPVVPPAQREEAYVPPAEEAEELVPLAKRETNILVPDPPVLKKPILSKEVIGSQNAENRRKSRAKTIAAKKASQHKEEAVEAAEPVPPSEEGREPSASMLKRMIKETQTQETPKPSKSKQRSMLLEMTNRTSGEKSSEKE